MTTKTKLIIAAVIILGILIKVDDEGSSKGKTGVLPAGINLLSEELFDKRVFPLNELFSFGGSRRTARQADAVIPTVSAAVVPASAPTAPVASAATTFKGTGLEDDLSKLAALNPFLGDVEEWKVGGQIIKVKPLMVVAPSGKKTKLFDPKGTDDFTILVKKLFPAVKDWVRMPDEKGRYIFGEQQAG